ncbi:MAG: hypothetical protein DMG06_29075 [Acidobacteria bacterium]|nr:MAG: hypothetical protein DMG06_29075 [Acidobacteriota bacterium]
MSSLRSACALHKVGRSALAGEHFMHRLMTRAFILILLAFGLGSARNAQNKVPEKKAATSKPSLQPNGSSWMQWGGANRDFISDSKALANSWPAAGPPKLWSRALGDGYSGIAVEGTTLYTVYRRGSQDIVTAIDASRGTTVWEYAYEAEFKNSFSEKVGPGPYAMPQVVGDRLVTASGIGKIQSLDKKTGRPVWSRDLYIEFGGTRLEFGYSIGGRELQRRNGPATE